MRRELGMMLAGLVVAGAVVVGAAGTAQAACEPDKVATKYPGLAGKTIKVGLDPTLPPIMYRDPNNPSKIIGQDPDMIEAAMKCLGLKYELVGLDFGTLVPTLQAGQIQLIWSNIYYTPARAAAGTSSDTGPSIAIEPHSRSASRRASYRSAPMLRSPSLGRP